MLIASKLELVIRLTVHLAYPGTILTRLPHVPLAARPSPIAPPAIPTSLLEEPPARPVSISTILLLEPAALPVLISTLIATSAIT